MKKEEMYGNKIPASAYRTQGAIIFNELFLKHTEIYTQRYLLC